MSSKFKGILDQAKDRKPETAADESSPPSPAPVATPSAKKRGRPSGGKRSDVDFVQVTAYIHKDTHRDVKIALLKSSDEQDFSELVDGLLSKWLKTRS